MARYAVCYVASEGYLFQTVTSAIQARAFLDPDADVIVVAIENGRGSEELATFSRVCDEHGVRFVEVGAHRLDGMHPMFARLFLDEFLPADVEEILYLDGDTQVLDTIDPLMFAAPPAAGAIGVRDPVVFIRESVPAYAEEIDSDFRTSGIPDTIRQRYINSGVLRLSRSTLPALRRESIAMHQERSGELRFADQDIINLLLEDRVDTVSMAWNFPGFLLGTRIAATTPATIVHFMSDPRPWNAPLWPWDEVGYRPYADLVSRHPQLDRYWDRFGASRRARYRLQQAYKRYREGPKWQSDDSIRAVERLATADRTLTSDVRPR